MGDMAALLVIDMQKFFFVENPKVDERNLSAHCNKILGIAREAGVPIVNIMTVYRSDRTDWPKAWQADGEGWCSNLVRGHPLSQLVDDLEFDANDYCVEKKRFSAFYNTNLDDILRSLGCGRIFILGYSADVCLRFTSVDAYNRGYAVTLIREGIESFRERKDASTDYLNWLIDAEIISLSEFEEMNKHAIPSPPHLH
jgi:nicotinamidase-related amidase